MNNEESYEKDVFYGQMVLYEEGDEIVTNENENNNGQEQHILTRKELLEEISKFGESVRWSVFDSRKRYRQRQRVDIGNAMAKYYQVLDYGVLGKLQSQAEYTDMFKEGWKELDKSNFPYFLYGTVAWERARKASLPSVYFQITPEPSHDCGNCFNEGHGCNHVCCESKLITFGNNMGFTMRRKAEST